MEVDKTGLTPKEQLVLDALVRAHNHFIELEVQHPSDLQEFVDGIHRCQKTIAMRCVRRDYPEIWTSKKG